MVSKNGISLVVGAVLLGQVSASGWFWGAPTPTTGEPTAEQVAVIEQTPTVKVEVTQAQVDQMFLQSMVLIPNEATDEVNVEDVKVEEPIVKVEEVKVEEPIVKVEEVKVPTEQPTETAAITEAVPVPESQPSASWGIFGWLGYGTQPTQAIPEVASEKPTEVVTETVATPTTIAAEFHVISSSTEALAAVPVVESTEAISEPATVAVVEEPKTVSVDVKPVEAAKESVEAKVTVTEAVAPVTSGWSFFRLWSSPAPVVAETPKVAEQSLEAAVAEAAEQPTEQTIPAETAENVESSATDAVPTAKHVKSKKTLRSKSTKRQATNAEASRPYRFRAPKQLLPRPIPAANTKMIHCSSLTTMSTISHIFDALTEDSVYARYLVVGIPAELMQYDRILEMVKAYGFEVVDKQQRSVYVQRSRRGTKLVSKLIVDNLIREDARRREEALKVKITPTEQVQTTDVIAALDFEALPTMPTLPETVIDPLQFGRPSYPSKNIPHHQKSVLRRKRTIMPAKGKSSVTSSGVNKRTAATSAKLTNGKRAMGKEEIRWAIKEAGEMLQALNESVEKATSSSDESLDEETFNFRGYKRNQRINKAAFPPLSVAAANPKSSGPNGNSYAGVTKHWLFPSASASESSSSSDQEAPIFDMNKFFARDRFTALPDIEPFNMDELFYPEPTPQPQPAQAKPHPLMGRPKGTRIGPNGHAVPLPKKRNNQGNRGVPAGRGRGRSKWVPKK